jgi:hypothetical protein
MNDNVSMLLGYLSGNKNRVSNVRVADYYDKIPYTSIKLYYTDLPVELQIYGEGFMKVFVNNEDTKMFSNVSSLCDYLYNLQGLYYRA